MVAFKPTTFAATVLVAVSLASAASLPVSKRQDAPRLNPFGALSLSDIPQRCRDTCDDVTELANNAQCLSNLACLCNDDDDEVDDIGECFSCVVRHTANEQRRSEILNIGRGVLSEYHQICNSAGHPVPAGTLADDGRYNDNDSDSGDDWDDNNSDDGDDQRDDDNDNDSGNESGHDDDDYSLTNDNDGDSNDGASDAGDDDHNEIDDDSDDEDSLTTHTGGNTGGSDDWDDGNDSVDESDDDDGLTNNGGSNTVGTSTGGSNNADGTTNALNAEEGATGAASGLRIPAAASLVGAFALGALAL